MLRQIFYPFLNFLESPKKRAPEGQRIKVCALIAGNESFFAIFNLNIRRISLSRSKIKIIYYYTFKINDQKINLSNLEFNLELYKKK